MLTYINKKERKEQRSDQMHLRTELPANNQFKPPYSCLLLDYHQHLYESTICVLPKHVIVVGLLFCPHLNLASPCYLASFFKLVEFYLGELSL